MAGLGHLAPEKAMTTDMQWVVAISLLEFAVAKTDIECPTAPVNELTAKLYAAIEDVGLNIPVVARRG